MTSSPSTPLRILQFVREPLPTYRPDVAVLFGESLPREGVEALCVGRPGADAARLDGERFTAVPARSGRLAQEFAYLRDGVRRLCSRTLAGFDVVQVRDMVSFGLVAFAIARLRGRRFVYWISFLMSEDRIERGRLARARARSLRARVRAWIVQLKGEVEAFFLYRVLVRHADLVVVQSEAMKTFVVGRGADPARLVPVPMGVDMGRVGKLGTEVERVPGWTPGAVIGYLGNLDPSRQLGVVVEALALLRRTHPQARLLLVGSATDPADNERLLARAAELGQADAVRLTGWLPTERAWALMRGVDVAVSFMPRTEVLDTNSPTKLLEYLALAIPCVGNDNPDQAEVLTRSGAGRLCASDVASLAAALAEMLDAPAEAARRAAAGPGYIRAHRDYAALARELAGHYRTLA